MTMSPCPRCETIRTGLSCPVRSELIGFRRPTRPPCDSSSPTNSMIQRCTVLAMAARSSSRPASPKRARPDSQPGPPASKTAFGNQQKWSLVSGVGAKSPDCAWPCALGPCCPKVASQNGPDFVPKSTRSTPAPLAVQSGAPRSNSAPLASRRAEQWCLRAQFSTAASMTTVTLHS